MAEGQGKAEQGRAELVRRIVALAPKKRIDAILSEKNAAALVRSLPAEELYLTIVELGLTDAVELVQLSSPEQFRTYVDLAGWQKDRLDPKEVLRWLSAAQSDDDEDFLKKVHGLDMEVLELVLRTLTTVHDLEENPDVNPPGVTLETPEGKYLVEFHVEGLELASLRSLVNRIIAENPFEASRLFEAVRWEQVSELEETAYQFRSGRLADLGFPPLEDAVALFSFVDTEKARAKPKDGAQPPGLVSQERVDFVEASFRGLTNDERTALADEVRYVVNAALVAEAAEPGDPLAVRRVSELARDYLNLALELLTGGDASAASDVVRETPLKDIFKVGFSLTLQLKHRVDRMAQEPMARIGQTWLALDEERSALEALYRRRPLKALKVDGAEPVPFRTRRELAESEALLDRAALQRQVLASALGGTPEAAADRLSRFGAPIEVLTPERVFITALAHAVLEERLEVAPLTEGRLVELMERLFEGTPAAPALRDSALLRMRGAVEQLALPAPALAEANRMVERAGRRLLRSLGAPYLKAGHVDPALADPLIV